MNKLQFETSPYLHQHKDNPVEWYPWGKEALELAKKLDKPILVSIGYSACHWCHVMAHECFENDQAAQLQNEYFINIKVDREERPDVDALYMDALQTMGLRGGWPLNVFLMPDAKPFYGGTYFPLKNWMNLLQSIQQAFVNDREKLQESADGFANGLQAKESEKYRILNSPLEGQNGLAKEELTSVYEKIERSFDLQHGGLGAAPKFPMPNIWEFLLSAQRYLPQQEVAEQIRLTLNRLVLGGIFDHVHGGWTRYSTDERWKVPHFEKMLYDNAQLLSLFAKALHQQHDLQLSDEELDLYRWALEHTFNWLGNHMLDDSGLFYAALDADSEGVEGKYYVFTEDEIDSFLKTNVDLFKSTYQISALGNWEHGQNILHLEDYPNEWPWLKSQLQILAEKTSERILPGLDHKLLCNWNALLVKGLADVYQSTFEDKYLDTAEKILNAFEKKFIVKAANEDQNEATALWHCAQIPGFLDDYACSIEAYLAVYQLTFKEKYLHIAHQLCTYCLANFYDAEESLFYFTDIHAEELIARKKELFDNVIPSSNSMMAHALYDLGRLYGDTEWTELATFMFQKVKKMAVTDVQYMANWLRLGLKIAANSPEIAIIGLQALAFRDAILREVKGEFYVCGSLQPSDLPLLKDRYKNDGKTYIYICYDHACQRPLTDLKDAIEELNH